MIQDQSINIPRLVMYTPLLDLWDIFENIITISPVDSNGFFTIDLAYDYVKDLDLEVTHTEFWETISYFLMRRNKQVLSDRERRKSK